MKMKTLGVLSLVVGLTAAWKRGDQCPSSIKTTIPDSRVYWRDAPQKPTFATVAEVYNCLVRCAGTVKQLDLRITLMGCSEWPDRWNLPFSLAGTKTFPELKELSLEGYDFEQKEWEAVAPNFPGDTGHWMDEWGEWFGSGKIWRWLGMRHLPDVQKSKTNLELWLDAMDFGQLTSLTLKDGHSFRGPSDVVLKRLPQSLSRLETLNIEGSWRDSEEDAERLPALEFITNIASEATLRSISWTGMGTCDQNTLEAVMHRHGPNLHSLEWRNSEIGYNDRPVFSASQIRSLGTLAPNLQSLDIDLNRRKGGAWPEHQMAVVVESLPSLTNVSFHFELQSDACLNLQEDYDYYNCDKACRGLDMLAYPRLDVVEAERFFRVLRSKKVGEELTRATFKAGDFTRPWDGPVYDPAWLEGRKVQIDCSVLDSDGKRKGESETVCETIVDRSLDEDDDGYYISKCGKDRTCQPRRGVLEDNRRTGRVCPAFIL